MNVVITGASGAIGGEIAQMFAKNGNNVALLYCSSRDKALALAATLAGYRVMILPVQADFTNPSSLHLALAEIGKVMGRVDVLVNCAGVSVTGLVADSTEADWDYCMDVNAKAVFITCKWAAAHMREAGRIVNISSIWATRPACCEAIYAASKAAVEAFTRSFAAEVGCRGITVNAIAAGMIDTAMNNCFTQEEKSDFVAKLPITRMGKPSEVAGAVQYLCSEEAAYITGAVLDINGGM